MNRQRMQSSAKARIATKIADIVLQNLGKDAALEVPGTFTALLEAYRAIEIAERFDTDSTADLAQDAEDYRQGVLRNQE